MNELPKLTQVLAVIKKKKHLMNASETTLLWDLYKYLEGTRKLSESKFALCCNTWKMVLQRERDGSGPVEIDVAARFAALDDRLDEILITFAAMMDVKDEEIRQLRELILTTKTDSK